MGFNSAFKELMLLKETIFFDCEHYSKHIYTVSGKTGILFNIVGDV